MRKRSRPVKTQELESVYGVKYTVLLINRSVYALCTYRGLILICSIAIWWKVPIVRFVSDTVKLEDTSQTEATAPEESEESDVVTCSNRTSASLPCPSE